MRGTLCRTGTLAALAWSLLSSTVSGYQVDIRDTDELREVCSGMYGGEKAYISLTFDPSSTGQLALVLYEWSDVKYLGADTPGDDSMPKTYICTTSAIRSGLCTRDDLGSFITTLPEGTELNQTSLFTTGIRFGQTDSENQDDQEEQPEETTSLLVPTKTRHRPTHATATAAPEDETEEPPAEDADEDEEQVATSTSHSRIRPTSVADAEETLEEEEEAAEELLDSLLDVGREESASELQDEEEILEEELADETSPFSQRAKRSAQEDLESEINGDFEETSAQIDQEELDQENTSEDGEPAEVDPDLPIDGQTGEPLDDTEDPDVEQPAPVVTKPGQTFGSSKSGVVPLYDGSIIYNVPKTGYYCVGVVPVTLINSKKRSLERSDMVPRQETTHASYSGSVLFKNTFEGQLPAAEYPKIGFYLFLSTVYAVLAGGWGYLCVKHYKELLPMQWYITGTIVFLVVEMLANQGYYRYINKHGGGSGSLAFLFVVAILNAGRNSISFFLLLVVSMGLSVVTPSLGPVMNRVRLLTAFHFVFGVLYAIGSVRVELETASLFLILFLIFPLALSLTCFLMWTIISLNGTIMHLQARKQRNKLAIFKRLYRILMVAVVAVTVFFVISTLALSNRADEDYAPKNWKYRWILLDASLAMIYLGVFTAIAWLWRPSRDNVRFAMSQELAQDEDEADGEGYELAGGRPVQHGDDDFEEDEEQEGFLGKDDDPYGKANGGGIRLGGDHGDLKDENVVFALEDDDSDLEGDIGRSGQEPGSSRTRDQYVDVDEEDWRGKKADKID